MSVLNGNNLHGNRVQHGDNNNNNHQAGTHQPENYQSRSDRERQSAQEGTQKAAR